MALTREAFAEQVKDALLHIYDLAYLPQLGLTRLLAADRELTWQERTQRLRRVLVEAIERLDPGPGLPLRARERRSYAILSACFARSMTAQAVMEELAISERQYWRERKRAIEALVEQLWEDYGSRVEARAIDLPLPTEHEELARKEADLLASHSTPEHVSLAEIVRQAAGALQKVIESRDIRLQVTGADTGLLVFADRTVLRQICLNLLTYAFDVAQEGAVALRLEEAPETVELSASTTTRREGELPAAQTHLGLKIVQRLVEAQGGRMAAPEVAMGRWSVAISLPRARSLPILVVDDNAATIRLFERYLAGTCYRVVPAESGALALELVEQVRPAAITLDVMMPGRDGWDTLQALRARPDLQHTPVIVCSVLDEPQLAFSLGADDFVRKPVNQAILLQALNRCLDRPQGGAPTHPAATADTGTAPTG